ncbi:hypothetical protein [Streptomyces beijiangensis]|uniref:Uncharacterized protein n=1 Tax=Streptomyces beijiangensis TaxID=163361 RepID=A0A939F676_9ACTN|nr:hypothetical protein [Streptomyces beijiangensis]MBO0512653.1 hypothetical protein [Streptomyces beijiangensis]
MADSIGDFQTAGDRVHVSKAKTPTASAHGWWINGSGPGIKAKVTIWLQAKDSKGHWHTVAKDVKTVKPSGGSQGRATARKFCVGDADTIWRSIVDVDVIGVNDSPDKLTTPATSLKCGAGL